MVKSYRSLTYCQSHDTKRVTADLLKSNGQTFAFGVKRAMFACATGMALIAYPVTSHAQSGGGQGGLVSLLLPIVLITGVFWFFLIRPQQKREKERQAMLASIQRGDKLITNGGVHASVRKIVDNDTLEVDFGKETIVMLSRQMVFKVLTKDASAASASPTKDASEPKRKVARSRVKKTTS